MNPMEWLETKDPVKALMMQAVACAYSDLHAEAAKEK